MKRKRRSKAESWKDKRQKSDDVPLRPSCALLRQYYAEVLTLREYLISRLPKTAKRRRRRIQQYGSTEHANVNSEPHDPALVDLLDKTLVGSFTPGKLQDEGDSIDRDLAVYTQQLTEITFASSLLTQGVAEQSEIVHFVIWRLFHRCFGGRRPKHVLCQGYQKTTAGPDIVVVPGAPGILANTENRHVQTLRRYPWTSLPALLGNGAERQISQLLIECGIFTPIADSSNFVQLSGQPLCDLKVLRDAPGAIAATDDRDVQPKQTPKQKSPGWTDIRFVRQRMLYARATARGNGKVVFGLGQSHFLNRKKEAENQAETILLAEYIFPREFGLHNVFTSKIDPKETAQAFKDYTMRDKEIARADYLWRQSLKDKGNDITEQKKPLPKRLRKEVLSIIHSIRKRHERCPYHALLEYYCPQPKALDGENGSPHLLASTYAQVSAFSRAVTSNIFPADLWGPGEIRIHNKNVLMQSIDRFIRLRRYENLSLHDVLQRMKIKDISWLMPSKCDQTLKLSRTDFTKRQQLLAELVYYIFDSFLMPLIRNNFHVTESNMQRNQLFYFRHDVWQALCEPAFTSLKDNMLEECSSVAIKRLLASRTLGVSQVRMLPKEKGMRPIINLRRRVHKLQYGELVLGKSINSILTPAFSVLNCERDAKPEMTGSALFSVDDIFPRLQAFRKALNQRGLSNAPLFFAKVDVQACFDTIPQKRLMKLVKDIIGADNYRIAKYSRAKLIGGQGDTPGFGAKPSWKFLTKATAGDKAFDFEHEVKTDSGEGRSCTVYVEGVVQGVEPRRVIINLLEEHVESNIIKLDKRYYRQKKGIPQGSIVSSLLCSYMYAELEREALSFLYDNDSQTLLLRLIDDFLVISTSRAVATRFIHTMHEGLPDYGVQVKIEKSRANFDISLNQKTSNAATNSSTNLVPHHPASTPFFPFCGHAIHTKTLDLSKDHIRREQTNLATAVTVEFSRLPGQSFYRKTLNAVKQQMHAMLLSTSHNKTETVHANLQHAFTEVAAKTYWYVKVLPQNKKPGAGLVIKALDDAIKLAVALMRNRKTKGESAPYECKVTGDKTRVIACTAFRTVLGKRQTAFPKVLRWLDEQLRSPVIRGKAIMITY